MAANVLECNLIGLNQFRYTPELASFLATSCRCWQADLLYARQSRLATDSDYLLMEFKCDSKKTQELFLLGKNGLLVFCRRNYYQK